ncbi:LOW QUALITY PROTEIN: probable glucan 1,3-beta-glucosidase A [Argentina anserina]|uniref:LOW QUALITY PROTEIN: probable glucan 1,3-beta-glucosidase A n=1 Tax=Argentina anserina TaxID=57926 RepID=UPI00217639DE|nr:LOW QUALITY PROTEIN: probable glucan 1,3-beta-glucosidase A [Potentilla anserina]
MKLWRRNADSFNFRVSNKRFVGLHVTPGKQQDSSKETYLDHWNSYITEEDFRFMSSNGLNAVELRIPVGWWIKYDQTPPKPFVGGSLQALENAFTWAQNTGMKVIIDLHAVNGSQSGNGHSGTRDGFQEWGDEHIDETVEVIDFCTCRFANHPALAAIELLNEPRTPGVTLDSENLKRYYRAGYAAVRKYDQNAYVILSNRLGSPSDPTELLQFAQSFKNVVIDVHY